MPGSMPTARDLFRAEGYYVARGILDVDTLDQINGEIADLFALQVGRLVVVDQQDLVPGDLDVGGPILPAVGETSEFNLPPEPGIECVRDQAELFASLSDLPSVDLGLSLDLPKSGVREGRDSGGEIFPSREGCDERPESIDARGALDPAVGQDSGDLCGESALPLAGLLGFLAHRVPFASMYRRIVSEGVAGASAAPSELNR